MKVCRGEESIEYATQKDADFVAYIVSPWHLLGTKAAISRIKEKNPQAHGMIFLCKNHRDQYQIKEIPSMQDVEFAYYESGRLNLHDMGTYIKVLVRRLPAYKDKKYFIIPYRLDPILYALYSRGKFRTECFVIDEGLGSYMGINIEKSCDMKRMIDLNKLELSIKRRINELLRRCMEFKLKRESLFCDFSLLKRGENNCLRGNKSVVSYYRHVMSKDVTDNMSGDIYGDAVLINTQPLEGVREDADVDVLYDFCKRCYEKGFKILIKPHPAESDLTRYAKLERYVSWDLRSEISQETILNSLANKPKAIVSFYSTTLITGNIFWGIPAFSLAKMLIDKNISDGLKVKLQKFISLFSNHTKFCGSIEEIVEKL